MVPVPPPANARDAGQLPILQENQSVLNQPLLSTGPSGVQEPPLNWFGRSERPLSYRFWKPATQCLHRVVYHIYPVFKPIHLVNSCGSPPNGYWWAPVVNSIFGRIRGFEGQTLLNQADARRH